MTRLDDASRGQDDRVEMWDNPSCSKCAAARRTLDEARLPYRLRAYLDDPPTAAELAEVLRRLGAQPWEICRVDEPVGQRLGLRQWPRDEANADRWIAAMVEHPELIQRPILLLDDGEAVIGRSPEALHEVVQRQR
jgi:arsenate reductase (glutaredoxin)